MKDTSTAFSEPSRRFLSLSKAMDWNKLAEKLTEKTTEGPAKRTIGGLVEGPAEDLGVLYGIGVGPGDPELLTLKAWKHLQMATVVAFPEGLNGEPGTAERIISPWLGDHQTRLPLTFPYVLEAAELSAAWRRAAQQVWPHLAAGRDVVFACEGDVSFYATFTYLAQSLYQQHPSVRIETIPGVSSPMAAAAALGIPLTCQGQQLAILPALYSIDALSTALDWADIVVLMKVSSVYEQVWSALAARGLLERSYIVEKATCSEQKTYVGLHNYPTIKLPYFSLLIVQCGEPLPGVPCL